jgi:hypothetical protein
MRFALLVLLAIFAGCLEVDPSVDTASTAADESGVLSYQDSSGYSYECDDYDAYMADMFAKGVGAVTCSVGGCTGTPTSCSVSCREGFQANCECKSGSGSGSGSGATGGASCTCGTPSR